MRKVVGSIPEEVIGIFNWPNPSSRTMALVGSVYNINGCHEHINISIQKNNNLFVNTVILKRYCVLKNVYNVISLFEMWYKIQGVSRACFMYISSMENIVPNMVYHCYKQTRIRLLWNSVLF
jgi:hypothetical protein